MIDKKTETQKENQKLKTGF